MENLLNTIGGPQPPAPGSAFPYPAGAGAAAAGAGHDGGARMAPAIASSLDGGAAGAGGDAAGTLGGDVKGNPGEGVRLLGAAKAEDGAESGEEDEAAPLDIDDLLEEPLCEKVKGLGTFYILIDKHSRKRKRGFTGLRRSQKAAIVRYVPPTWPDRSWGVCGARRTPVFLPRPPG